MHNLTLAKRLTKVCLSKFYRNNQWYLSNDSIEVLADFDDRYYTSTLSQMLENLVKLTSITGILKYEDIVKKTIQNHARILHTNLQSTSKLAKIFLHLKKGDIIVHSSKEKLLLVQDSFKDIKYPFLLSVEEESDEYLACKITMCFAHDKNITKLIDKINKAIQ